jgi:signal transduction histidine kinase
MSASLTKETIDSRRSLSGARGAEPVTIDAGEFLSCMCEGLREHAERKDVRLVVFATCGGVHVHERSFAAAILALVNNAVDAAEPGARVIITARPTDEADALPSQSLGIVLAQLAVEQDGGFVQGVTACLPHMSH